MPPGGFEDHEGGGGWQESLEALHKENLCHLSKFWKDTDDEIGASFETFEMELVAWMSSKPK